MPQFLAMDRVSNRVGVELLFTDCDLAMTFLSMVATTRGPDVSQRNLQNARKAYEAILHHTPKLVLSAAESRDLRNKLSELRRRLKAAERI